MLFLLLFDPFLEARAEILKKHLVSYRNDDTFQKPFTHSELIILIDSMWEERRGYPRAAPALTDRSPRAAPTAAAANPPI